MSAAFTLVRTVRLFTNYHADIHGPGLYWTSQNAISTALLIALSYATAALSWRYVHSTIADKSANFYNSDGFIGSSLSPSP
jgi:hypothetical protein